MKKTDPIYVVDLFCGMGGFSCGASYAGAKVVLAIDSWEPALLVHELNHPDCAHIQMELGGDLSTVCDLIRSYIPRGSKWHLHGSPPCQMLSRANRNTNSVNEGMFLVDWFLDLVEESRPDSWSMEQVPMALKYLNSSDFDNCEILNAKDFGVPQTRKRLFIGDSWSLPTKSGERSVIDVLPHLAKEGTHIKGYSNTRPVIVGGKHIGNRKMSSLEGLMPLEVPTFTLCASGPLHLL